MRIVVQWLGVLEPDRSRPEPVAPPTSAPIAASIAAVLAAGVLFLGALFALLSLTS